MWRLTACPNYCVIRWLLCIIPLTAICFGDRKIDFGTALSKFQGVYEKCGHSPLPDIDDQCENPLGIGTQVRALKEEIQHELYWLFRACPIYFHINESIPTEALYVNTVVRFIDNDPDAPSYLCEALENFYSTTAGRLLHEWVKSSLSRNVLVIINHCGNDRLGAFMRLLEMYGMLPCNICAPEVLEQYIIDQCNMDL